jgi:hypothetical protein
MIPWLLAASLLHGADAATTHVALNRGAHEKNPIFFTPYPSPPVVWSVTGGTVVAEWVVLRKLHRHHPKWATALAIGITAAEATTVAMNLREIHMHDSTVAQR